MTTGDRFIIKEQVYSWNSHAGGLCGHEQVEYPYTSVIINITDRAIVDCSGWGWNLRDLEKTNSLNIILNLI